MAVGQRRVDDSPPPPSVGGLGQWKIQNLQRCISCHSPDGKLPLWSRFFLYFVFAQMFGNMSDRCLPHHPPLYAPQVHNVLRMCFWRLRGMSDTRGDTCIGINLHCTTSPTRPEYRFWTRVEKHGVVRRVDKCGPY